MSTASIKVALVQELNQGDAQSNLARIEQRVAEAAQQGAQLVLLQELHNGAYFCQHESADEFDRAEPIPGPSCERLSALAKRHGVVLIGSLVRTPRRRPLPQYRSGLRKHRRTAGQIPQNAHSR